MTKSIKCCVEDIEEDKPSRVIHAIAGGDVNLKQPYVIAFVVNGARKQNDYLQVMLHHKRTSDYLKKLKQHERESLTTLGGE